MDNIKPFPSLSQLAADLGIFDEEIHLAELQQDYCTLPSKIREARIALQDRCDHPIGDIEYTDSWAMCGRCYKNITEQFNEV